MVTVPNAFSAASNARRHRRTVAHVGLDRERPAAGSFDARFERSEPIGAAGHQHDRSAVFGQNLGETDTEPARRAGDERDFPGKSNSAVAVMGVPCVRIMSGPLPDDKNCGI